MDLAGLAGRNPLVVAGIDPGTFSLGFGIVGRRGEQLVAVDHGAFQVGRSVELPDRLLRMHDCVMRLLKHHRPDVVSLEQAFYQRNIQSALRLGEVRGSILVAARSLDIPVVEYPTAVAKKSVAGHGGASKEAVRDLVTEQLGLARPPEPHDATDALALALCLLHDPALDARFSAAREGR